VRRSAECEGGMNYTAFIASKAQVGDMDGFDPIFMPNGLFEFQQNLVEWAVRKGRSAIFADCGLGKTALQLAWGANVTRKTNRPILVLTPLAVSHQTKREADKFGIEADLSIDGVVRSGINIANYERLHYFNPNDFAGAVCDESSILKSFDGVRRAEITDFMRKMQYRLLCTATPSPNEYVELGTSSEALGYLGYMDMLSRFFKNNQGNSIKPFIYKHKGERFAQLDDNAKWRFKGHAEVPFWQWVCSWSRSLRRPSDLGFSDDGFILPPLIEQQHDVEAKSNPDGMLFALPAQGLREQREERRCTINERCERAAALVNGTGEPAITWCDLNDEGDALEEMIPDCVQVSGKDDDETKEAKFLSFISGNDRVLVTKDKIGGLGLNLQHCAHVVQFPTHSWESYYQRTRRCLRFGQKRSVKSDIITTEGEKDVLKNMQRKAVAADRMFSELVKHMNNAIGIKRSVKFTKRERMPAWL
jgi:Helicase conserved C-terminal domain